MKYSFFIYIYFTVQIHNCNTSRSTIMTKMVWLPKNTSVNEVWTETLLYL